MPVSTSNEGGSIITDEFAWLFWCFLCLSRDLGGFSKDSKSLVILRFSSLIKPPKREKKNKVFGEKGPENHPKAQNRILAETLEILREEGKNAPKRKEFLGTKKKSQKKGEDNTGALRARAIRNDSRESIRANHSRLKPLFLFRKILVSVKFCPQFWGRKWVRQFYGRLEFLLSFCRKISMSIKFLVLGGGHFGFGGGGSADFILWARGFF